MIGQLPGRLHLGRQHGQALADALFIPQGGIKGLPFFQIGKGNFQCLAGLADGHAREHQAFVLKVVHDGVEAPVFFAQQIASGHAAVGKEQLRRIGTAPAMLVQLPAGGKARRAFLHHEDRDAPATLDVGVRAGGDKEQIAMHAVGNEQLGSVQDIIIAVAHGAGGQAGHVRARAWFGDRDRRDEFSSANSGQIFCLLRRAAIADQMRRGHVGVHQHGGGKAAKSGASQFLRQDQRRHGAKARAAMLFRMPHAQEPQGPHFAQNLAGHHAFGFPGLAVWHNLLGHETPQLVPD